MGDLPATPRADFVGKRLLGRYVVGDKLAEGGMGAVYRARDDALDGKAVVVKVPHARFLAEAGFRERFEREMRDLLLLEHPHVARILAKGDESGVPFFVLPFLAGGSLRERLRAAGGMQTSQEVAAWLPDVARTLDFIHARGVIHRDVKPANVLFDEHGNVFVSDFGIAKALGALDTGLTQTGATPGSPDYMAPEVVLGGTLGAAYDQYALAVVVYEALAGRLPHGPGETPVRVLFRKAAEAPVPLREVAAHVAEPVAAAVMRALDRDPARRFASCAAFAAAVTAPATAPPRVAAPPPRPPVEGAREATRAPAPPPARGARTPVAPSGARVAVPRTRGVGRIVLLSLLLAAVGTAALAWREGWPPFRRTTAAPAHAAAIAQAVRRVAAGDVAAARRLVAEARAAGAVEADVPVEVREAIARFDRAVAEAERLAKASAVVAAKAHLVALRALGARDDDLPAVAVVAVARLERTIADAVRHAEARDAAALRASVETLRALGATDEDLPAALVAAIAAAPPDLVVDEPADGAEVAASSVTVRGALRFCRATDVVRVGDREVRRGPGPFEDVVALAADAPTTLRITVEDGGVARLAAPVVRTVRRVPPWRALLVAAEAAAATSAWERAKALVEQAIAAGAKAADVPASVRDGVAAYDAPPVVAVTSPAAGAILTSRTIVVEGTLDGRATDEVAVEGVVAARHGRAFSASVTVPDWGTRSLRVEVTDRGAARHTQAVEIEVRDPAAPAFEAAPAFTLKDLDGRERSLADFRGKWVVLEFTGRHCPFVASRYQEGPLAKLQAQYQAKGVVWLAIATSVPGRSRHGTPEEWRATMQELGMAPKALLLDEACTVGRAYGASRTLDFRIIDPEGRIVYAGALDAVTGLRDNAAPADTYVAQVLDAVLAGEQPPLRVTKPYG